MTSPPRVLELTAAVKSRSDGTRRFVLQVPAFRLDRGEKLALVGRSGSGKSTLIEILAAALRPDSVKTFRVQHPEESEARDLAAAWEDNDEAFLSSSRARCFGYVQQIGGLLRFLTTEENIALSLRLGGKPDNGEVEALAEALGIARYLKVHPDRLSVGERQRVAIARALVHHPALVLADEPTGALDIGTAEMVMQLFVETAERWGTSLILATHDPALAESFGFRLIEAQVRLEGERQWTDFTTDA
ncbi:MAG: ATP-binding cassette domain-containing protein [Kiloniellales bacterium]